MRLNVRHATLIAVCLLGGSWASLGVAQPSRPEVRPGKSLRESPIAVAELLQNLASEDKELHKAAIDKAKAALAGSVLPPASAKRAIDVLLAGKHFDEAADLAWTAITTNPGATLLVSQSQEQRIDALIALGKGEEALSAAKSLFNVTTMSGTSQAILTVAKCLNVARPKDKEMFNKFRQEQIDGANAAAAPGAPASISSAKGPRCSVLDSIKVDPAPFDALLAKMPDETYEGLLARGNLLLMADKVKDARDVFDRMYAVASSSQLVEASEAVARCIRAEDGTIGRANTWIQAIRPKPATAPSK